MVLSLAKHEEGCVPFRRCRACIAAEMIRASCLWAIEFFERPDFQFDPSSHLEGCEPKKPCENCYITLRLRNCLQNRFDDLMKLMTVEHAIVESAPENEDRITLEEVIKRPISVLDLSSRPYNALTNEGIKTLGALCSMKTSKVRNIQNLGRKSLDEIREALSSLGLRLDMDIPADMLS